MLVISSHRREKMQRVVNTVSYANERPFILLFIFESTASKPVCLQFIQDSGSKLIIVRVQVVTCDKHGHVLAS